MSEFTAGPWEVRETYGDSWPDKRISIGPQDMAMSYCVAISPRYAEHEQMIIDARLIAAAPDLYHTVAALTDALESLVGECPEVDSGCAALAKAEGKV
jgi:hypothetical protein